MIERFRLFSDSKIHAEDGPSEGRLYFRRRDCLPAGRLGRDHLPSGRQALTLPHGMG